MSLTPDVLAIAEDVISEAGRDRPADAVLRIELKKHRDLAAPSARAISRAVFAYYRWWKWLEGQPLAERVKGAVQLQERFSSQPSTFTDEELAAKAVPQWVKEQSAVSPAWLRSLQAEPKLWLRAKAGHATELAKRLGDCYPPRPRGEASGVSRALADTLEYRGEKDLFRTPAFHAGEFEIQDISSQLVSLLCEPEAGQTWWDACAGEGGKTVHLSDLMRNQGLIWASDRAAWRLQKLKRRAARAKVFNYRSAAWDGGPKLPTKTKFDGVLVDAPCSGLGTWQRNPDSRWTTTLQDIRELSQLQIQLLAHAAPAVKPSGKLIYAVCTLPRAETVDVVKEFERQFPGFAPLPLLSPFHPAATPLWIWPQDCGGNGMFLVAWRKKGS